MTFHETLLPEDIAEGARGGRGWSTDLVRNRGAHDKANQNWSVPLGAWDISYVNKSNVQTRQLLAFFLAVGQGKLNGFRFKDLKDCNVTKGQLRRLTSTTYQMVQRYRFVAGGQTYSIDVTKPEPNDTVLQIWLGNTETTAYTVNTSTGVVTFASAVPANVVVSMTGAYHIPVRFDMDEFEPIQTQRGYWNWTNVKLVEIRV